MTFATLSAKVLVPRWISATHEPSAGSPTQSAAAAARPQVTSVAVMPAASVRPANSSPKAAKLRDASATAASLPCASGTEDRTPTPGPDRSMPWPLLEKSAITLFASTAATDSEASYAAGKESRGRPSLPAATTISVPCEYNWA